MNRILLLASLVFLSVSPFKSILTLKNATGQEKETAPIATKSAGNADVLKVMETFQGKGALADGSLPTPAIDAVKQFKVAAGVQMELVASEPTVMQPLSMNFDERGRLWVVQYRQYPFPAGLKVIR